MESEVHASRHAVEEFIFFEARLLDEWRLREWFALMTEDCSYVVPATDAPSGSPHDTVCIIADDHARLKQRVDQLEGNSVWCENPRSRTRRLIGNVSVVSATKTEVVTTANFIVHRFGSSRSDVFVGQYRHDLVWADGKFRIRKRLAILDHQNLMVQGKISIIL